MLRVGGADAPAAGRGDCHDAPHGAEARQEREHEESRADGDAAGGRKGADGGGGAGDFPARPDRRSGSKKVLEKLGLRRYPTEPEQTMYSKWLVDWQFTPDAILRAVDETIKSSNPSFAYLDGILKRLHEQGNVRTEQDVSGDIEGSRKENEPIKQFLRALGNYSITINDTTKATYKSFQTMYPDPVILLAAQQCAKWGMTTLQDVMQTLMAWQNRSLRTLPEIDAYMRQIDEQNEFLIVLYQAMQLDEKTKPNAADRALVKQWTEEWRFAQMFVLGCAPWAAGRNHRWHTSTRC